MLKTQSIILCGISQLCLQSLEHYKHYKNMQFLKVKIVMKQTNKQTIPITVSKVNVKKRHNQAI